MEKYSIYGSWSIEEAKDIGKKFKARCKNSSSYSLTEGKEYIVTIVPRILTMSPLCEFISDNGKLSCGHLERFEKIEAITE